MQDLTEQLAAIEHFLLQQIPIRLRALSHTVSHYAMFLQYVDYSHDVEPPVVILSTVAERVERLNDCPDMVWMPEFGLADIDFDDKDIVEACELCYELMQQAATDFDEDDAILLPFRQMLYRVCQSLAADDSIAVLNPTDDFVVTAVDATGFWFADDMSHCVSPDRMLKLKESGYYPA